MLTIFTCPKPFRGHIDVIQRNAIRSWLALRPRCEIILVGNEAGVSDVATELGVEHLKDVERNERGTPYVPSVFSQAERQAHRDIVAYVNADIVLGDDFLCAARSCSGMRKFLMVGERINTDVGSEEIEFGDTESVASLFELARETGRSGREIAIDYFVFRKGLWKQIPSFALGRCAWDNWLIYGAIREGAKVIDASGMVAAIHQEHDYGHTQEKTRKGVWFGEEAARNYELADRCLFTLLDCRYALCDGRVLALRDELHVRQRMDRMEQLKPQLWKLLVSWKARKLLCWLFPKM